MKISESNIQKKLETIKKSQVNKNKVSVESEMANKAAKLLFRTICDFMPAELWLSLEDNGGIDSVVISKPETRTDGTVQISIQIPSNYLKRDSLYSKSYPNGIDNIINLFDKGYKANRHAFGYWRSVRIRSKIQRPTLHFMETAINHFNSNYFARYKCRAILGERYT